MTIHAPSPRLLPDPGTEFGARVRRRLAEERVVWLTAVADDGTPQPNPVWFVWDGDAFLIYTSPDSRRMRHLLRRPRVSLHFNGDEVGHDIVVFGGVAEQVPEPRPAVEVPEYHAKYREAIDRVFGGPGEFTRTHPVALRIRPTSLRGR
ncbi:TIGR03667 family PPOX class F420-dependent oxidoreductase [Actinomadura craniellae]|uniref:TIGR03667 family PPOX class F420-dependent oxidoreductase n=1 Tax=Actinomadura craniellae TaxID=2231787 RepID=A0A365HAU7_9ACTN|nr:TIGR03667 family PPOX class F420-dependent oxidoreductase [Actinomadura craniellae]RAY16142.1 TIGR03667 family PPOX class F420-dependent oxidoreductase [Actinomadura craniellae]